MSQSNRAVLDCYYLYPIHLPDPSFAQSQRRVCVSGLSEFFLIYFFLPFFIIYGTMMNGHDRQHLTPTPIGLHYWHYNLNMCRKPHQALKEMVGGGSKKLSKH